jgi:hypothetical protein
MMDVVAVQLASLFEFDVGHTSAGEPIFEPQRPWQVKLDINGDSLGQLVADTITLTSLEHNSSTSNSSGLTDSNSSCEAAVCTARAALKVLLERFGCR